MTWLATSECKCPGLSIWPQAFVQQDDTRCWDECAVDLDSDAEPKKDAARRVSRLTRLPVCSAAAAQSHGEEYQDTDVLIARMPPPGGLVPVSRKVNR